MYHKLAFNKHWFLSYYSSHSRPILAMTPKNPPKPNSSNDHGNVSAVTLPGANVNR